MSTAAGRPGGRPSPLRWILLGLLLLPLVEVVVLVAVGQQIGFWWTLALIVGMGALGAWLARRESGRTWRALQDATRRGGLPADELTDTLLVTLGGFMLILPGFVTDVIGLVLVLPWTRPWARRLLQATVVSRALGGVGHPGQVGRPRRPSSRPGAGEVIEGEVVSQTPPPGRPRHEDEPPMLGR